MSTQIIERTNASLVEKIVIRGRLHLDSPLSISGGDTPADALHEVDNYVLRDKQGQPFIPGSSLAGVLRAAVFALPNIKKRAADLQAAELLFGRTADKDTLQSALDVSDIVLPKDSIAVRDGVAIDGFTGTAIKSHKYDYEVVDRGNTGNLELIITLRQNSKACRAEIDTLIGTLLRLLSDGIRIGAGTAKGFGKVSCKPLYAVRYDFSNPDALKAWLGYDAESDLELWWKEAKELSLKSYKPARKGEAVPDLLTIDAWFSLNSSLIVRKYGARKEDQGGFDAVSLQSAGDYLIPGTTMKGVLRHQAEKILTRFRMDMKWLNELMGYSDEDNKEKQKSRFYIDDIYIKEEAVEAVAQSHNRIDRFTGGTVDTALFTTKPLWKKEGEPSPVKLHLEIQQCSEVEAGLALFLLRDLWQGRIAVGGEKAIGRGTLCGQKAEIHYNRSPYQEKGYVLDRQGKVQGGRQQQDELEHLAQAFTEMRNSQGEEAL